MSTKEGSATISKSDMVVSCFEEGVKPGILDVKNEKVLEVSVVKSIIRNRMILEKASQKNFRSGKRRRWECRQKKIFNRNV